MLQILPSPILSELEILRRQETSEQGLKFLSSLLDRLAEHENTTAFIADLREKAIHKRNQEGKDKEAAINWIREIYYKMKNHSLANHPLILPSLEKFKRTLDFEHIRFGRNYITSLLKDLKEVVCLLASFGKDEIFESSNFKFGLKTLFS